MGPQATAPVASFTNRDEALTSQRSATPFMERQKVVAQPDDKTCGLISTAVQRSCRYTQDYRPCGVSVESETAGTEET